MSAHWDLLRELADAECTCKLCSPNGMISFWPATRQTRFNQKPQQSVTCVRCRVRQALAADGYMEPDPPINRGGF